MLPDVDGDLDFIFKREVTPAEPQSLFEKSKPLSHEDQRVADELLSEISYHANVLTNTLTRDELEKIKFLWGQQGAKTWAQMEFIELVHKKYGVTNLFWRKPKNEA